MPLGDNQPNRFPATCGQCRKTVHAGAGWLTRNLGKWGAVHRDCSLVAPVSGPSQERPAKQASRSTIKASTGDSAKPSQNITGAGKIIPPFKPGEMPW